MTLHVVTLATAWAMMLVAAVLHRAPWLHLDVGALVIAYLVLERPVLAGAATAMLVGYLQDLGSGAPTGLHAAASVIAFFACRAGVAKVHLSGPILRVALALVVTFSIPLLAIGIDGALGAGAISLHAALPAFFSLALTSIALCYPVHRVLARIDAELGSPDEDLYLR